MVLSVTESVLWDVIGMPNDSALKEKTKLLNVIGSFDFMVYSFIYKI